MPVCPEVPHYFLDRSTHVRHPCDFFCNYEDPDLSSVDCDEWCPDLYACLRRTIIIKRHSSIIVRSLRAFEVTAAPQLGETQNDEAEVWMHRLLNYILVLSTIAMCVIISLVISCQIYKRRRLLRLTRSTGTQGNEAPAVISNGTIVSSNNNGKECQPLVRRDSSGSDKCHRRSRSAPSPSTTTAV